MDRIFNARPDRLDFRDRMYFPPLRPLPARVPSDNFHKFWTWFSEQKMVRDQKRSPSCTGQALAGMIEFRAARNHFRTALADGTLQPTIPQGLLPDPPSADMLYQLAKVYDDRAGEAYRGSSCRGAMKGWHHHGVLSDKQWREILDNGLGRAKEIIQNLSVAQALRRPGAYYRVKVTDVDDVRAAIKDADCVYASLQVHTIWRALEGWHDPATLLADPHVVFAENAPPERKPKIDYADNFRRTDLMGGHAVVLVGYDHDGFIVLNSWSKKWGCSGLAWLGYDAWQAYAMDAWVAVEGAPMNVRSLTVGLNKDVSLLVRGSASNAIAGVVGDTNPLRTDPDEFVHRDAPRQGDAVSEPWTEQVTHLHSLLIGLDGRILNRRLDVESNEVGDATPAARRSDERLATLTLEYALERKQNNLVLVFGAGLESEELNIANFGILGSILQARNVATVFVDWGQGLWPVIADQVVAWSKQAIEIASHGAPQGWWHVYTNDRVTAVDDLIESAAQKLIAPALWTQRNQAARDAAKSGGALNCLARAVAGIAEKRNAPRIHIVAHSGGAILACRFLALLSRISSPVCFPSCTLLSPACDMADAASAFRQAFHADTGRDGPLLAAKNLHIVMLPEELEEALCELPEYSKSALHFMSKVISPNVNHALLGLRAAWWPINVHDHRAFNGRQRAASRLGPTCSPVNSVSPSATSATRPSTRSAAMSTCSNAAIGS